MYVSSLKCLHTFRGGESFGTSFGIDSNFQESASPLAGFFKESRMGGMGFQSPKSSQFPTVFFSGAQVLGSRPCFFGEYVNYHHIFTDMWATEELLSTNVHSNCAKLGNTLTNMFKFQKKKSEKSYCINFMPGSGTKKLHINILPLVGPGPGLPGILPKTPILACLTTQSIFHSRFNFLNHISGISTAREWRERRKKKVIMKETMSNQDLKTILENISKRYDKSYRAQHFKIVIS